MAIDNPFVEFSLKSAPIPAEYSIGKVLFIVNANDMLSQPEQGKKYYGPFKRLSDVKDLIDNNSSSFALIKAAFDNDPNITNILVHGYILYAMKDVTEATRATVAINTDDIQAEEVKGCIQGVITMTIDDKKYVYRGIDLSVCVDEEGNINYQNIAGKLNKLMCEVEGNTEGLTFISRTYGEGGNITFEATASTALKEQEKDLYTILHLDNITTTAGVNATGFDLNKLVQDNIFEVDFKFTGFTTNFMLDFNTIKNIVNQINEIKADHNNRSLIFAYQLSSYKDSMQFHTEMAKVHPEYQQMISVFTCLQPNKLLAATCNGAFLSYCCSVAINQSGPTHTKLSMNGKEITAINIDHQEPFVTTNLVKDITENIAMYCNVMSFGRAVKISDNYFMPIDAFYIAQIIETINIEIANFFKLKRDFVNTSSDFSVFSLMLYNVCNKFLKNNILNPDIDPKQIESLAIRDIQAAKAAIAKYGIYFELPEPTEAKTNTLNVDVIIAISRSIAKVNLVGTLIK